MTPNTPRPAYETEAVNPIRVQAALAIAAGALLVAGCESYPPTPPNPTSARSQSTNPSNNAVYCSRTIPLLGLGRADDSDPFLWKINDDTCLLVESRRLQAGTVMRACLEGIRLNVEPIGIPKPRVTDYLDLSPATVSHMTQLGLLSCPSPTPRPSPSHSPSKGGATSVTGS